MAVVVESLLLLTSAAITAPVTTTTAVTVSALGPVPVPQPEASAPFEAPPLVAEVSLGVGSAARLAAERMHRIIDPNVSFFTMFRPSSKSRARVVRHIRVHGNDIHSIH